MIQKISYLGNDLFQLDDSKVPLEIDDIKRLAMDVGKMDEIQSKAFLDKLKESGEASLETTAATGVVVNVYEVDYVPPKDPRLETQQLGATVREQRDFITQYLFPSTETEDVIVGLRKDLSEHDGGGRMPKNKKTSRKNWRQVLSWRTEKELKVGDKVRIIASPELMDTIDRWSPFLYHSVTRCGKIFTVKEIYPIDPLTWLRSPDPYHPHSKYSGSVWAGNVPFPYSHWKDFMEIVSEDYA